MALGGIGLTGTAWLADSPSTDDGIGDEEVDALVALAETLYPSEVEVSSDFVETYVSGQRELDTDHVDELVSAVTTVRQWGRERAGSDLSDLTPKKRGEVLRATGADRAYPDPDGTEAERIRYYVVNNLLYALYTTPKGGKLVGNPNPPGHPGGTEAYQEVSTDE